MLRRSRLDEKQVVSAVSPDHDDIMGRVAIMGYKNGREDIALLGTYVPPKPTGVVATKRVLESLRCVALMGQGANAMPPQQVHAFIIWRHE